MTFNMNRRGKWKLSPAFDVIYSCDPRGDWTSKHQMSINEKRDMFDREDLCSLANIAGMKVNRANEMLDHVIGIIRRWKDIAYKAGVDEKRMLQIQANHRLSLLD